MNNKVLDEIDDKIILYKRTRNEKYFNQACEIIYPYLVDYATRLINEAILKQYIDDIVSDTILKMYDKTLMYYTHYARAYYYDWCCSLLRSIKSEYMNDICIRTFVEYHEEDDNRDSEEYIFSHKNDLVTDKQYKEQLYGILSETIRMLPVTKRRVIEEIYINKKTYQKVSEELKIRMDLLKYYVYSAKNDIKKLISQRHPNI